MFQNKGSSWRIPELDQDLQYKCKKSTSHEDWVWTPQELERVNSTHQNSIRVKEPVEYKKSQYLESPKNSVETIN